MKFRHVMVDSNNPADPHCKTVADLDGDGRGDLLVASAGKGGVWWYRALQEVAVHNRVGGQWEKTVLSTTGSHGICLVDAEGQGRRSVYGANWNNRASTGGAVELWVQE